MTELFPVLLYVLLNGSVVGFGNESPVLERGRLMVPLNSTLHSIQADDSSVSISQLNSKRRTALLTIKTQPTAQTSAETSRSIEIPFQWRKGVAFVSLRNIAAALRAKIALNNKYQGYRIVSVIIPQVTSRRNQTQTTLLFEGHYVSLNAVVTRLIPKCGPLAFRDDRRAVLFEARTEDGVLLRVVSFYAVKKDVAVGRKIRMTGKFDRRSVSGYRAKDKKSIWLRVDLFVANDVRRT